jgi:hypothetical protein
VQVSDQRLMLTHRVEHDGLVARGRTSVQEHAEQRQYRCYATQHYDHQIKSK